ncbi:MAG: DUF4230 domain-containing protein [Clostridiales Family XIII bacterium]|jgi:hypothetical protein|nr:DUF4230 domain-containing protein [Clostridiales Family XIII bacterium]
MLIKKIATVLEVVIVLAAAAVLVVQFASPFGGGKPVISEEKESYSAIMVAEAIRAFKIASLEYRYTNVVTSVDAKSIAGLKIGFTEKSLIVQYDGVIQIGVDGDLMRVDVDDVGRKLLITLPAAEILSHTQIPDSTFVLVERDGLFNSNKVSEYTELFNEKMKEMEAKVINNGYLETAYENAVADLTGFINAFPDIGDNYEVIVR